MLCSYAAILDWQNKETATILNHINMVKLCTNVTAAILE